MRTLYTITLNPETHKSTDATLDHRDGQVVDTIRKLAVATFGTSESAYYLLYFDDSGNELTDTWHESLKSAFAQAEFEFGVNETDWSKVSEHQA